MSAVNEPGFFAQHPYAEFLHSVHKPARYTGGELGVIKRDWGSAEAKICLAFPDVYDIGMSHLGYKILYEILNKDPRTLAERAYAPWTDMEAELRERGLPLVSHESWRPLRDFDVVGLSLQFELTYTNCLTMLDLGQIPLLTADRGEEDPLIVGGGPNATHPEPVADFFDCFAIGDGERACTEVALSWVRNRAAGLSRKERLVELSKLPGVYVPSLYRTSVDADSGLEVVQEPLADGVPARVERTWVRDLSDFPFPAESPVGGPEAIFDRMSIEIARGCTEGCRFCQAGMIYRPVRERDPEEIVNTVVKAIEASGQDEVSLTSLSTADSSCIAPLVKEVTDKLTPRGVSLAVSSLRAYGLSEDVLDDMRKVRVAGLTFAPEAGSQRMRDVVNKNVTEDQLLETAERIFGKGWDRMKLYFMIGLPTEEDEDIQGIVASGRRALDAGRAVQRRMKKEGKLHKKSLRQPSVVVSVSTHVPKPHTPFQWCAMDQLEEVRRKQQILRDQAREKRVTLRTHDASGSVLEGIFARGDRRLTGPILRAWKNGARFDSWEEHSKLDVWAEAFEHFELDTSVFLGTLPVTGRLPWDHIDVGLEDGFLAREYRKALQNRLSPPCGKAKGMFVHHTNRSEAEADARKLICYDCGVACDMEQMRDERIEFLDKLGAETPRKRHLEVVDEAAEKAAHLTPGPRYRYRLQFSKHGPVALLGHLDLVRAIPRVFRRIGLPVSYTQGFRPKPDMTFSAALSLGVPSNSEFVDLKLLQDVDEKELVERLNAACPEGLAFVNARRVHDRAPSISKLVGQAHYAVAIARSALPFDEATVHQKLEAFLAAEEVSFLRVRKKRTTEINLRSLIRHIGLGDQEAEQCLRDAGFVGDLLVLKLVTEVRQEGGAKVGEILNTIFGTQELAHRALRMSLQSSDGRSPLEFSAPKPKKPRTPTESAAAPAAPPAL